MGLQESELTDFKDKHIGHPIMRQTTFLGQTVKSGPFTWGLEQVSLKCLDCDEEINIAYWEAVCWASRGFNPTGSI